ncbi:MAG: MazG nucleotide pyrophosphohydrolase domain-containing protein [Alphaproteobacteria bacterium]
MSDLVLKENPTLKDLQEYITAMKIERGFNTTDKVMECFYLMEEVGELVKAVRKNLKNMQIDANKTYDTSVGEEVADVLIFLLNIANLHGIDVEQAFRDKEEINKRRTWKKV